MARVESDRNRHAKKPASSSQPFRSSPPGNCPKSRQSSVREPRNAPRRWISSGSRSIDCRSRSAAPIKSKTPPSPSPRCTPQRSKWTTTPSRAGSRQSSGRRASSAGTSERSSTARTIRQAHASWQRHGGKILATSKRRLCWPSCRKKTSSGICAALGPIARRWLLPSIRSERALAPEELRLTIQDQAPDVPSRSCASFATAWAEARRDAAPILVTGSLHFAGEALAFLQGKPAAFEECLQ